MEDASHVFVVVTRTYPSAQAEQAVALLLMQAVQGKVQAVQTELSRKDPAKQDKHTPGLAYEHTAHPLANSHALQYPPTVR